MKRLRRRILLIVALLSLAVAILGGMALRRWQNIAYLQRQFARSWEISYNFKGAPPMLPPSLRRSADDYFRKQYGSDAYPKNYPELLLNRFESLFLGRIKAIDVWYPGGWLGNDLGGALSAFPHLEDLWVMDNWDQRPVEQWEKATEALASLKLKRLALMSVRTLSPKAIEGLSRSKSLRELRISSAEINEESIAVFTRWGTLEKLVLENCEYKAEALMLLKQQRPTLLVTEAGEWGFCREQNHNAGSNLSARSNPPVRHTACSPLSPAQALCLPSVSISFIVKL